MSDSSVTDSSMIDSRVAAQRVADSGVEGIQLELFSSSFCGACRQTRAVLERAVALVPGTHLVEHDVGVETDLAVADGIRTTPTVIVHAPSGAESFRAGGVPMISQVLTAMAQALDEDTDGPLEREEADESRPVDVSDPARPTRG